MGTFAINKNISSGFDITVTPTLNMKINIGDVWKDVIAVKINIGDTWKDVEAVLINVT